MRVIDARAPEGRHRRKSRRSSESRKRRNLNEMTIIRAGMSPLVCSKNVLRMGLQAVLGVTELCCRSRGEIFVPLRQFDLFPEIDPSAPRLEELLHHAA